MNIDLEQRETLRVDKITNNIKSNIYNYLKNMAIKKHMNNIFIILETGRGGLI